MQVQVGPYKVHARLDHVDPPLATQVSEMVNVVANLRASKADEGLQTNTFLAETIRYPNEQASSTLVSLVGIDQMRDDLERKLVLLLSPGSSEEWAKTHYRTQPPEALLQVMRSRYPLFVLEGDVGSGKTALARSIGNPIAFKLKSPVVLFVMNAQVRGTGHVGEMTQNISRAFDEAERCEEREQVPTLLLIDEADALAQTRGGQQTHHEDDAGVNTLIQRIDRLRGRRMAVLFATNLVQSLDSAILRRAAAIYHFSRPSAEQRLELLRTILAGTGIRDEEIQLLVQATEPKPIQGFGNGTHRYTYSDITQRVVPRAVETAIWSGNKLTLDLLLQACNNLAPTPELPAERR
jgi:SpoVK/Ycf46/Vps4 family AAA+-type ATPase